MKSILLVDDNPLVLRALAHQLRARGADFDVSTALNGREAIQLATTRFFDLLITDILMPERDGFETICAVRQAFPSTKIIAMTGGSDRVGIGFLRVARSFGAHETLSKPFSDGELFAAVSRLLPQTGLPLPLPGQSEIALAATEGLVARG